MPWVSVLDFSWWRPAPPLIFVFMVLGLINPGAVIFFLTSYDEVEGYFVLFVTFKVELLENQIGLLIRFRRN
jgi:hypothetical protein